MEPFQQVSNRFFELSEWTRKNPQLRVGFTTRLDGVSSPPYDSLNLGLHVGDDEQAVIQNRELLAAELQVPLSQWVFAEQIHGSEVVHVTAHDRGAGAFERQSALKGADGLYTSDQGILLCSLYADCVPLYFYAEHRGAIYIGLAHAGWKGTVGQIGAKLVHAWTERFHLPKEAIHAAIGPSISCEAYEVDQVVIDQIDRALSSEATRPYVKREEGRYQLDLKACNEQLLIDAGLEKAQILVSSHCSAQSNLLFSHRHEGGKTGRMMSFIGVFS
ncbi:peptidoglycan editing factor PgeF [Halalkalibacterium halodurans]|jgi:YfiH family protein|uniref:peptidoglycan editing factor PgeF n=1 Tax=Halalkalibacterium halodurans TaxID=86665 RepID=UPI0006A94B3C|nr:peptidoglycan editing factor PgeF [Halalkalibacterium halodurans]MED3646143.1 peptidoglycan editing factor PgeF [Halalkalibacterium halodurans]TES53837.1 peptidoglycan editing factor PgeF [Halalkalibacterium halodurans]TPE66256.1 peptidoglycan editing factor PgeF [Halalkalibacterium halodurans]